MVERLFLRVPWGGLRFVIVVFPDHTHYFYCIQIQDLFLISNGKSASSLYYDSGITINLIFVFLMSCGCLCSMYLPHGTMGWSAVCDYGISWSYSFFGMCVK